MEFYCILLFLVAKSTAYGQTDQMKQNMPDIQLVSAYDMQEKVDGKLARASTVMLTFGPKAGSAPHRHPGPVLGYVLEGTLEFKVEGKPMQLLNAGETFYEPTMILHEVARNPSDSLVTKVLATVVHPRDVDQLVIPENMD